MEQDNLLFYNEYEQFYEMAQSSEAFRHFCVFTCYQEGDVVPKTENADTSQLAQIFRHKSIHYDCTDITRESYDLLLRKKKVALSLKDEFEREGNGDWCDMLIAQTEYADKPFEEYRKELARYVYVVRKNK